MSSHDRIDKKISHNRIVEKILPRFAEKLKEEGLIIDSNRKRFKITRLKGILPLEVNLSIMPDRVVILRDGRKVLIEVANPKEQKRFLGELLYIHTLIRNEEISLAIVFVLPPTKIQHKRLSAVPVINARAAYITWIPGEGNEHKNYSHLKDNLSTFISGKRWPHSRVKVDSQHVIVEKKE